MDNMVKRNFPVLALMNIPNFITLTGLFLGVLNIYFIIEHKVLLFYISVLMVSIMDTLDGFAAKKLDRLSPLGAELDSLCDTFNILEVKARLKAIMRRTASKAAAEPKGKIVEVGDLVLDCEGRRVSIAGREVNLTAKEFDVLELLVFNPNKVYSRENLLNIVWGYEYPGDVRTVDVHIRRLREKIEANPSEPKYVHTKWGVGYYFCH